MHVGSFLKFCVDWHYFQFSGNVEVSAQSKKRPINFFIFRFFPQCYSICSAIVCWNQRHNDTPVVRASGRELSYILLAGIIMCYSVTFALVLRPTDITCGIQRYVVARNDEASTLFLYF